MSDTLKKAFAKPRALSQSRYYAHSIKPQSVRYPWDLYPHCQDYFHEFNPYFVHLIQNEEVFNLFSVFTVRDGMYTFAEFIVKNVKRFPKWRCTFLIPESYAGLVPENLSEHFLTYRSTQLETPDISKAKSVLVLGLLNESYLGPLEKIEARLAPLKDLDSDVSLEACLPLRADPLMLDQEEKILHIEIPDLIRKYAGNRKIKWVKQNEIMSKSVLRDFYLLDLKHDHSLVFDSFLHFWVLSRGGMVNSLPAYSPGESLFEIDLSFRQRLTIKPMPKVESKFIDLILSSRGTKNDLWTDPNFQECVRGIVTGASAK